MSPISPFCGLNSWDVQVPDYNEKCPICGSVLEDVWGTIGGFPGHEHVHPSSVVGYRCNKCIRYFPLGEFLMLKLEKEKKREEAHSDFAKNYWQGVRAIFKNPYLYLIVVGFMLISRNFWVGILAGVVIVLLMPLLAKCLEIVFTPLGRLVRKILPSDKSPDNPKTP